jgi:hypothetical protein
MLHGDDDAGRRCPGVGLLLVIVSAWPHWAKYVIFPLLVVFRALRPLH